MVLSGTFRKLSNRFHMILNIKHCTKKTKTRYVDLNLQGHKGLSHTKNRRLSKVRQSTINTVDCWSGGGGGESTVLIIDLPLINSWLDCWSAPDQQLTVDHWSAPDWQSNTVNCWSLGEINSVDHWSAPDQQLTVDHLICPWSTVINCWLSIHPWSTVDCWSPPPPPHG